MVAQGERIAGGFPRPRLGGPDWPSLASRRRSTWLPGGPLTINHDDQRPGGAGWVSNERAEDGVRACGCNGVPCAPRDRRGKGGCLARANLIPAMVFAMSWRSSEPIIDESSCTQLSGHRTRTFCDRIFVANFSKSSTQDHAKLRNQTGRHCRHRRLHRLSETAKVALAVMILDFDNRAGGKPAHAAAWPRCRTGGGEAR